MANDTERHYLDRHYLCRVVINGLPVWRVLCLECRNRIAAFKRIALSERDCDLCGSRWEAPRGGNLFVKDRTVTITAHYPDLESARNKIAGDK